jgi:hypothetical protein
VRSAARAAALALLLGAGCRGRDEPAGGHAPAAPPPADPEAADRAEVEAAFAEIVVREEAALAELGNYVATGDLESELWPEAEAAGAAAAPTAPWRNLGAKLPERPRCRYVVLAGTDQEAVPGLLGQELLGASFPGRDFWYAVARCGSGVYGRANLSPATRRLRRGR